MSTAWLSDSNDFAWSDDPSAPQAQRPSSDPVRAGHAKGSGQAKISKGEQERGGSEAVEAGAEVSYGVTSATVQILAGYGQSEQRKTT